MFKLIRRLTLCGCVAVGVISFPMWRGLVPPLGGHAPAALAPASPPIVQNTETAPGVYDPLVIDPVTPTTATPPTPAATATATAAPIVVATPPPATAAPAPTAAPKPTAPPHVTVAWVGDDCSWAMQILTEDEAWDRTTAANILNGTETRYPGDAPIYTAYAAQWQQDTAYVGGVCNVTPASFPTAAQDATAISWFAIARSGHVADEAKIPADTAWDSAWIANYDRLISLFAGLPV